MPSVDALKAEYKAEKKKVTDQIARLIGSRQVLAVFAATAIAFGTQLLYAPGRFPAITAIGPQLLGFGAAPLDFGKAGEAAQEAAAAAERQGAMDHVSAFLAAHPIAVPILNGAGLAASLAIAVWTVLVLAKRMRTR